MLSVALGAKVIVTRSSAMLNIQRGNRLTCRLPDADRVASL
jgi:hypothetical protein